MFVIEGEEDVSGVCFGWCLVKLDDGASISCIDWDHRGFCGVSAILFSHSSEVTVIATLRPQDLSIQ